jgi:membrane fusion protein (multidrug efflux system)
MKKYIIYFTFIPFLIASCGQETPTKLDELITKRDSLKLVLADLNMQIEALDTSKSSVIPMVTTSVVKIEDFVHKVRVPGTVETDENALINSEASGVIKQIHIKEGDRVSKGQVLVTIDSEILAATMDELETSLELATYMFEKQTALKEKGVGIEIEYEQARNQKLSLEQKMKTLRSQQGKSIVRAPFSGIVDDIMVNQGEMAAPQIPLLRIVNNDNVTITSSLSENMLSKVFVGTKVELSIPSMNDTVIYSVISNKGNYIDATNRTFKIQVAVKNNKLLLPNQFAELNVTDFTQKSAKVINAESVLQDTKNNNYVYRLKPAKESGLYIVEKVFVKVIMKFEDTVCIEGELNDGDILVVKGAKGITISDKVKIQA